MSVASDGSPAPAAQGTSSRSFRESLLAVLGLAFVTMLVALDQTVVGTALPTIVAELNGFELYAWTATAYLLTSVVTVPVFGRLGDYYGRKPFVVASIVVFSVASLLCGAANSMTFLVWSRALQGIGGGMLVGTAFACIPDLFPDARQRLRWQVLISTAFGIANAVGPSLGGILTEGWGWRSVFYVNLPVTALSLFFVGRYLPHVRHRTVEPGTLARLDWLGAALIALTLGSLQMAVEIIPQHGFSLYTGGLLVLTVVCGTVLFFWERRHPQPMLPLEMWRHPCLAELFNLSLLGGFALFAMLFYAPLLFQGGFGWSPREAGLVITPLVVCITVGSIVNGRLVSRMKTPNRMLPIGFGLLFVACIGLAVATTDLPRVVLMVGMLCGGVGLGFILPNLTVFAQQTAPREQLGIATALLQSLRMVGGMIGAALVGTTIQAVYHAGVRRSLGENTQHWYGRLADPQLLVNAVDRQRFVTDATAHGDNGALLVEAARHSLVGAIHIGIAIAALVTVYAMWRTRRVPPVSLHRKLEPTMSE
ncbi:MDR family MFS transporter [Chitinasiproducens palmae]|uniref:Drug resistance transporter, EmrB/QacA subfamily n=1 Tax=Chitinasiproducens palmae TaxID=1770053 RepID=A0A1H2PPF4_9BURK|nr:MDR family MFS transporter [Chitinasiproducens palmae]SDV48182.1 drug resistance transporter, EmrB/QacA subfamily [Chitinasiproducens palmae]